MRLAYDALGVDVGYLSSAAATWFGTTLPRRFLRVDDSPVVRRLQIGGVSVALVLFPPEPATEQNAPKDTETSSSDTFNHLLKTVLTTARSVEDADIRIGISPWGFQRERQSLPSLAQAFDVLIGGGAGAPLVAEVLPSVPSLLWSRPESDGKSVMVLDLMEIPAPGSIRDWTPGLFSQCRELTLTSRVPADPQMEQLLSGGSASGGQRGYRPSGLPVGGE